MNNSPNTVDSGRNGNGIRVIAPSGALGAGYDEPSFWDAMERERPAFIGCDSGSTDPGPWPLGSGTSHWSRIAFKRDLGPVLEAARKYDIPFIIGSAATAGADPNLAWAFEVFKEVAAERNLHFKIALVHAEQDPEYVKRKLREGKIRPLNPAPEISEERIDNSTHIVGMMGVEPIQEALDNGADVVLCGRASDTSIFSAIPISRGLPAGLVWHAAKVLECGGASAEHTTAAGLDGMIARIFADHFELEPVNPDMVATPTSIASHTLYENRSPSELVEPSGVLDVSQAAYTPIDHRSVRVAGSIFTHSDEYTIKLEGAEKVGYQTIIVGGIRDPQIIRQFDSWLDEIKERSVQRVSDLFHGNPPEHHLNFRVYGKNGVLGDLEPIQEITSHELCLIVEATAPQQDQATAIAHGAGHIALHHPIPEWSGLITGLAWPYAPAPIERGLMYRFNMNHVVVPDDPLEMFPIEYAEV